MLSGQKVIAIPLVVRLESGASTFNHEGHSTLKSVETQAIFDSLGFHLPIARVGCVMEVAVSDQGFSVEFDPTAAANIRVLNIRSVLALLHPHTLFENGIGQSVTPDWLGTF